MTPQATASHPRPGPAPPLLMLLPALVLLPLAVLLPGLVHGGGWELIGQFAAAALTPSLDPALLASAFRGLGVTVAIALLGWALSLALGLVGGVLSSRTVWRTLVGGAWSAVVLRRFLAVPRSIHELLWGLLLLQLVGLQPAVAVLAIAIPYAALVARVISDLLDALPTGPLDGLRAAGAGGAAALLTALGPALLPGAFSYSGYRLECALRSATLLGVFGLGGLGTELRLTLQSLQFHELWTCLWLLLAVMLLLEGLLRLLRQRWGMPGRFGLAAGGIGSRGRELLLALLALLPVLLLLALALGVNPAALLVVQALPPFHPDWPSVLALPWGPLVGTTVLLSLLAAALAVGVAPLLLLLVAPWPWGRLLLQALWALGRLWPPPLTALLLLFVLKPGLVTAALALAFHNLGVLGRLLLEAADTAAGSAVGGDAEAALRCAGCGPRLALFYGRFSGLARSYLAYGAYRADVILRETVVVGLVGAAGLGTLLLEALSSFAVDQLLALVAVYAVLTLVGEDLSDRARRRLLAG